MRPVDADALKKALEVTQYNDIDDLIRTERLIDNAPTVEPCYQTTSCLDCGNYDKENHNCPRYCEVIKEAINSRPQGEWIPVSERLPEECGYYLVFTSNNDIDIGTYHPVTYHPRMWSMCDANGFYWADNKNIEVLAWQPLPEPYKKGGEE